MKILFIMRHPFFLKNFTAGLRQLLDRGHQIEILFSLQERGAVGESLANEARIELVATRMSYSEPASTWQNRLITLIATVLDVRRYDHAAYDTSPKLRERAQRK